MANLLAFDTTTDLCVVGLGLCGRKGGPERWFEDTRCTPKLQSGHLLPMIDELVRKVAPHGNILRLGVSYVAFGAGPGSFVGVRLGAAAAQGLAFALGARTIAVPSSAIAAEVARAAGRRGAAVVHRRSRPGWRYAARYRLSDDGVDCLAFDRLESTDAPAGDEVIDGDRLPVDARAVARLAWRHRDGATPPASALPIYVEGDAPWKPRVQDRLSAGDPNG